MTTNETLVNLERNLEADLLEARRELELGKLLALRELDSHQQPLGSGAPEASGKILSLTREAEEDLGRVQARLGELNYVLAEDEINDLGIFDRYRDRILGALLEAQADLTRLERDSAERSRQEEDLADAWRRLCQGLELVNRHLQLETKKAKTEFALERTQLSARLEGIDVDVDDRQRVPGLDFASRLRREFHQALPGIKAMFMYADGPGD